MITYDTNSLRFFFQSRNEFLLLMLSHLGHIFLQIPLLKPHLEKPTFLVQVGFLKIPLKNPLLLLEQEVGFLRGF